MVYLVVGLVVVLLFVLLVVLLVLYVKMNSELDHSAHGHYCELQLLLLLLFYIFHLSRILMFECRKIW